MDYTTQSWRMIFEAMPIIAALFTIILSAKRALTTNKHHIRIEATLYMMCAMLLIVAQSSWSWTLFIKKDLLGSDIANVIWTWFNMITMLSMAYAVKGDDK